jgi:hypothetical protein
MLSMPFADETSSTIATKKRAAADAGDDEDGDGSAAGASGAAYSFEGYQIESSERVMLTPMGVPSTSAARPRP